MRMYFNGPTKKLELFDDTEPSTIFLEVVGDLYKHADRIKAALRLKLG